jgi:hypothetical protein
MKRLEPEEAEGALVAGDEFLVREGAPAALGVLFGPGGLALVPVLGVEALHELIDVGPFHPLGLEGEVLVGAQVVNPEFACPRLLGGGLAVEEEDVRLDPLGVEDAGGQAQERVTVALLEQLAADRLSGTAAVLVRS